MGRTMGLTDQQRAFCDNYLIDLNATHAAVRAGYSPRTADRQGSRLLKNAEVKAAIAVAQAERSKRTGVTADRVLLELARLAFARADSLMRWGPDGVTLLESSEIADDDLAAVAEVSWKVVRTMTTYEDDVRTREDTIAAGVKLHDKMGALNALMKHLGMNAPIKVDLADQLRKAAEAEGLDPDEMVRIAAQITTAVG